MRSNINMGKEDEYYYPILKVPQYQRKLKVVSRRVTGFALFFAAVPAFGLYTEYFVPAGVGMYLVYRAYEKFMSNPMFSKLIYEIYVNEKDPNSIKYRTYNGYFKGEVEDIEAMMSTQDAYFNLNLHGKDRTSQRGLNPEKNQEQIQQTLPQSMDPRDTYFSGLKNEVNNAYIEYLVSDKQTDLPMSKDTRQFVFTIRMKEAQEVFFVGLTWGLEGMTLDKEALMRVISGGKWSKKSHFLKPSEQLTSDHSTESQATGHPQQKSKDNKSTDTLNDTKI